MFRKNASFALLLLLILPFGSCKSRNSSSLENVTSCPVATDWTNAKLSPDTPLSVGSLEIRHVSMTRELANKVFSMVQKSYQETEGGSPYKDADDIGQMMDEAFIAEKDGKVILIAAAKSGRFGRKVNVVATDGSSDSMAAARRLIRNLADGTIKATYAELSGVPLFIAAMARDKTKVVPFEKAKEILSHFRDLKRPTDEQLTKAVNCKEIPNSPVFRQNAYTREIGNIGVHTKVMIGSPGLP